jgi:uncharacterized spore protein YtfJ
MSTNDIGVGDTVRVGRGKTLWTVHKFWTHAPTGTRFAALRGGGGYSGTSVTPDRLTVVTKAGAS